MANTPESSDHTSIKERIAPTLDLEKAIREQIQQQVLQKFELPLKPLAVFEGNIKECEQVGILFGLEDYLKLVDATGKVIRNDKRGAIPLYLSPILERLGISHGDWLKQATEFESIYRRKFARKRRKREAVA